MARAQTPYLIGVDWGTTHLRAYSIDEHGALLEQRSSANGVAQLRGGDFNGALHALIEGWRSADNAMPPIIMCGMVGSKQGWRETPYLSCPTGLDGISNSLQIVDAAAGPAFIVPGLTTRDAHESIDVMRGEETQIIGVALKSGDHVVVAPGTHSKWAYVRNGAIQSFRTYMTGEIFTLLRRHSVLSWLMPEETPDDSNAFEDGVRRALQDPALLHILFSTRTAGVFAKLPANALPSYLSGLLIGSEISFASGQFPGRPVTLIASAPLSKLYARALSLASVSNVAIVDATEAVIKGFSHIWRTRKGDQENDAY